MAINDNNYNSARATLVSAGSGKARAAHEAHTQGAGSPLHYGQALLKEARDEFRNLDIGKSPLTSGMTSAHHTAIMTAANKMGIDNW